jgi:hypothetical protein
MLSSAGSPHLGLFPLFGALVSGEGALALTYTIMHPLESSAFFTPDDGWEIAA